MNDETASTLASESVKCKEVAEWDVWWLAGGILSDVIGTRMGMRGRLWWLFFVQMAGAVLCIILGIGPVQASLANSIGVMVVFSFFIEVGSQPYWGDAALCTDTQSKPLRTFNNLSGVCFTDDCCWEEMIPS